MKPTVYKQVEIYLDDFADGELLDEVTARGLELPAYQWPQAVRDAVRDRDAALLLDVMDSLLFPEDRTRHVNAYRRWQHERRAS